MNNAKEHRFASLISENNAVKPSAPQVSFEFTKDITYGVFHFTGSGTGSPNKMPQKRGRIARGRVRKPKTQPSTQCAICMETIPGKVTLKCGHEMCPSCYAMHSRVNNTCPFCRDEFAPEIKKSNTLQMPIEEAEFVVEESIRDYYYDEVEDELVSILKENTHEVSEEVINKIKLSVYCHMYQMSMNTYHAIDEWVEENGG